MCFPLVVSELLYALQWCKEVEYSSSTVASYHRLLTDWGLSEGIHSQVPVKDLLETLYSRWATVHSLTAQCEKYLEATFWSSQNTPKYKEDFERHWINRHKRQQEASSLTVRNMFILAKQFPLNKFVLCSCPAGPWRMEVCGLWLWKTTYTSTTLQPLMVQLWGSCTAPQTG